MIDPAKPKTTRSTNRRRRDFSNAFLPSSLLLLSNDPNQTSIRSILSTSPFDPPRKPLPSQPLSPLHHLPRLPNQSLPSDLHLPSGQKNLPELETSPTYFQFLAHDSRRVLRVFPSEGGLVVGVSARRRTHPAPGIVVEAVGWFCSCSEKWVGKRKRLRLRLELRRAGLRSGRKRDGGG